MIDYSENRNIYMPNLEMKNEFLLAYKYVFEYPDYKNSLVNESVSDYFHIPIENFAITCGSLEAVNLIVNCLNKNKAILFQPTFWGYEDALKRYGYNVVNINLDSYINYNLNRISDSAATADLLFICNPNNPTLSYISKEDLLNLILSNPNCHFVVDETMLIFDLNFWHKTIIQYVEKIKNLSVIISFSKFLGIAGLRTGVVFSNANFVTNIKKMIIPYSLGVIQQHMLPIAFKNSEYLEKTKGLIKNNRDELCSKLINIGCNVIDGNTNYILVKLPEGLDANIVSEYLFSQELIVRNIKEAYPLLEGDWLRISINTPENNDVLVRKLKSLYDKC